jgi:site-specific recombinase XerD
MFEGVPLDELDCTHVQDYHFELIHRSLAPMSVNQKLSSVRFLFRTLLRRTLNPCNTPNMKIPQEFPKVLTPEEVSRVVVCCKNSRKCAIDLALPLEAAKISGSRL